MLRTERKRCKTTGRRIRFISEARGILDLYQESGTFVRDVHAGSGLSSTEPGD